jgi:hypothetical protein
MGQNFIVDVRSFQIAAYFFYYFSGNRRIVRVRMIASISFFFKKKLMFTDLCSPKTKKTKAQCLRPKRGERMTQQPVFPTSFVSQRSVLKQQVCIYDFNF